MEYVCRCNIKKYIKDTVKQCKQGKHFVIFCMILLNDMKILSLLIYKFELINYLLYEKMIQTENENL